MIAQIRGAVFAAMLCAFAGVVGYALGEGRGRADALAALPIVSPKPALNAAQEPSQEPVCPQAPLLECQAAREELRRTIEGMTGTQAQLREDLEFYRGLVDSRRAEESVRLHSAEWRQFGAGRIVLRLVLVRTGPRQKEVSGRLELKLRGIQDTEVREVFIERISVGAPPDMEFSFRNFHEWEIELRVPASFKVERLIASLHIEGQKEPVVESWTWTELEL